MLDDVDITDVVRQSRLRIADSISLSDFLVVESGSLLPPADICIEHGIESQ